MIDNLVVFVYLISILFTGLLNRAKNKDLKTYSSIANISRGYGILMIATIFASAVGGGTVFGLTQKAYIGAIAYPIAFMFNVVFDVLIAKYIVPRLALHYQKQTPGDIMAQYYGTLGRIIAGIGTIISSMGYLAAQILVSGTIFQYILEINKIYAIFFSYAIVIAYTTFGGLKSIVFTNLLQFFTMIIAVPIIAIIGIKTVGWSSVVEYFMTDSKFITNNLAQEVLALSISFSVITIYPTFIQRILLDKEARNTTKAIYIKSIIYFFFIAIIMANGVIVSYLFPGQDPALAFCNMIDDTIPVGLKGLVIIGLLSATMSTADSDLNVISISLTKDIISPIFNIKNNTKLLMFAKIANIVIALVAILLALKFEHVVDLVVFITGFWVPIVCVPLVFALYKVVVSKWQMGICSFLGGVAFASWHAHMTICNIKGVFIGALVSCIALSITHYLNGKCAKSTS
ncbi:Sodium:solute symporter family protein [Rickettsiales endosymbiont of Paramecium tredecaurelia]|uniref:sodium:solute symporter family protein n=1 Tax=Candidatus Sarmatiella mevalonica TaxID=2770581 RepID=UPI001920C019|nr:sodium:solute symporter family protein [Candidatus Sarmatiella mevalonica]MBL3284184.1 Sodium:solute symporter family protein [Candidatus Sarmatiella mevalonica]